MAAAQQFHGFMSSLAGGLTRLNSDFNEESVGAAAGAEGAMGQSVRSSRSLRSYLSALELTEEDEYHDLSRIPLAEEQEHGSPEPEHTTARPVAECRGELLAFWKEWNRTELAVRGDVDSYLASRGDGAFVVRPSQSHGTSLVLCFKFSGVVIQNLIYRVDTPQGEQFYLAGFEMRYPGLVDLLAAHMSQRGLLPCLLRLQTPGGPTSPPHTTAITTAAAPAAATAPSPSSHAQRASESVSPHTAATPLQRRLSSSGLSDADSPARPRSVTLPAQHDTPSSSSSSTDPPLRASEGRAGRATRSTFSRLSSLVDALRNLRGKLNKPSDGSKKVMALVHKAIDNPRSMEGRTIHNFVLCTRESDESRSHVITRNIRQFIDGVRRLIITEHRTRLAAITARPESREIPVEAIIEAALQTRVVGALHSHVYPKICEELQESFPILRSNMSLVLNDPVAALSVPVRLVRAGWDAAVADLHEMTRQTSALAKIKYLLSAVTNIHEITARESPGKGAISADDFLPIFVFVLCQTRIDHAEAEAEYIWALAEPSILTGEAGYYLTTLSSAVHLLKHFVPDALAPPPAVDDLRRFLRIYFPDPDMLAVFRTVPVGPTTTAAQACAFIADKMRVISPAEFGLYEVVGDTSRLLAPDELPQTVRAGWPKGLAKEPHFSYRRRQSVTYMQRTAPQVFML
eukprot:m.106894 g.106894  ORF g.106894 m.106894 type:complete len:687 (-) comp14239_c0_seq2:18-2078(-)